MQQAIGVGLCHIRPQGDNGDVISSRTGDLLAIDARPKPQQQHNTDLTIMATWHTDCVNTAAVQRLLPLQLYIVHIPADPVGGMARQLTG